jgi:predicted RNase H-like HicB family nuclease
LELHLEDEDGRPYPMLFVPNPVEIKRDGLPYVLIAKALALVKLRENTVTGKKYLAFDRHDENGVLKPISLGETLEDVWQELDEDKGALIKQAVENELVKSRRVDQLDALTDLVRNDVNAILANRGVGNEDQISRELGTAAGKAIACLNEVKKKLR